MDQLKDKDIFRFERGDIIRLKEPWEGKFDFGIIVDELKWASGPCKLVCVVPFSKDGEILLTKHQGEVVPVRLDLRTKNLRPYLLRDTPNGYVKTILELLK